MSLRARPKIWTAVRQACESAFPEEGCGLLLGPVPKGFDKPGRKVEATEARVLPNLWGEGPRANRYAIDSRNLMKVERELEGTRRGIVGFFHSHPDAPAWPSPFDLERAWPCYSYWIVSVRAGRAADSRSWMRSEDGRSFIEEDVTIS